MKKILNYLRLNKIRFFSSVISIFLGSFYSLFLQAEVHKQQLPEILWVINEAPPFYILDDNLEKQGFGDLIQEAIIKQLPQYNHRHKTIPLKRVLSLLKANKPLCFSTWIHNTRADIVTTSIPYLVYEPHGIIIGKKKLEHLQQKIHLSSLLKNNKLTLGIPAGRGYGKALDDLLKSAEGYANIYQRAGQNSTQGIFKMLQSKRIDYTLEYIYTYQYFKKTLNLDPNLVFIPLADQSKNIPLGAIACTNGAWGDQRITDINVAIKKIRNTADFNSILARWFVFEHNKVSYWELFNKLVVKPFP